jgi:hypothetical protein
MDQNQLCLGIKKSCLGYSAACYRLSFRTKRETLHQCIYARTLKRLISLHCYLIDKKHEVLRKSSLIGKKLFLKMYWLFLFVCVLRQIDKNVIRRQRKISSNCRCTKNLCQVFRVFRAKCPNFRKVCTSC